MLKTLVLSLVLLTVSASAQTPPVDDRFYQAIRLDDLPTLRALVRERGVNVSDAQGQTPLMLAAAFGSPEAVRLLIASGADVRAAGAGAVTALHWAVTDLAKTRMLLDANADVNAVSQIGRTPLLVAASANGTQDVVRLLVARGAGVNAADALGVTALIAAANVDNVEAARELLAHGADAQAMARVGQAATPLMGAAVNGNIALVRALLTGKPDLTVTSADRTGSTKNGPVRYGTLTALHAAVTGGNPDVVESLLKAGAPIDALDSRGMTPLMWAVATDHAQSAIVRLLVARGAKREGTSTTVDSAVVWARKFNDPRVLAALTLPTVARATAPLPESLAPASSASNAVARSLPLLRAASARTMTDGGCGGACHAQPLTAMALDVSRARGWTTASSAVESAHVPVLLNAAAPQLLQLRDVGGLPDGLVYPTTLMAAQRMPPTRTTDAIVHYLAAKQHPAGNWTGIGATRAPMQDGDFSRTAMSIRALAVYATPARAREYRQRADRAAAWISSQTPLTTEDRVMQLLGLHWADADPGARRRRVSELLALQREDGGWAQTPHLASDAYATGQVLYTLRELGVTVTDAILQRGAAYLLRTQRDDGSWYVKSRAMKIQPYFESGFPYGHDQWISQAGTAWAVMGLAAAARDEPVPPARAQAPPPLEDKFFDSNGVRIRYVEAGRGEPVVLINGFGDWIDGLWRNSGVIDALATDFHVIALDCRGHGKSGKPHDPAKYGREMIEDVARLLDRLQIRRAHIVGYSMGGLIAGTFAAAHPDRVLTMTFGASYPRVWTAEAERDAIELAESLEQGKGTRPLLLRNWPTNEPRPSDEELDRRSRGRLTRNDNDPTNDNDPLALAAVVRGSKGYSVTPDEIKALSMPLLAVVGSVDAVKRGVDEFKRLKPEVKLVVIEGVAHAGVTSRPEFKAAVREFLLAHRTSASGAGR